MFELNSPREFLIGVLTLVVIVAGLSIAAGALARGNFSKAMTKAGIVLLGLIIAGLGAAGGNALINMGQGGAEQIGIQTGE